MKKWFRNLNEKLNRWMEDCYGTDELGILLMITATILVFCCYQPSLRFLSVIGLCLMGWASFRCFSKDHAKRQKELDTYLRLKWKAYQQWALLRQMWNDRKYYRYYKCPRCGAILRVPKGKNKIEIRCTRCNYRFIRKT